MPESCDDGIAASISHTTTSVKHNRTNPQLQPAIVTELNRHQSNTKGQLLINEKEDHFQQVNPRQQTTKVGGRDSDSTHPSRAMQWVLLISVAIITLTMLIAPLVFATLKGQALLAIPSVGILPLSYVWVRIAQFVFPTHKRDHEYRMAKLWLYCLRQYPEDRGNKRIWEHKQLVQDEADNVLMREYKDRN